MDVLTKLLNIKLPKSLENTMERKILHIRSKDNIPFLEIQKKIKKKYKHN